MTERLRVSYSHKFSQKTGQDEYDTASLGAEWEFDVPDGVDIQREYANAYAVLHTIVDGYLKTDPAPRPEPRATHEQQAPAPAPVAQPVQVAQPVAQPAQPSSDAPAREDQVVEHVDYEFTNQPVWGVEEKTDRRGQAYLLARIGNKLGEIPTTTGYARVKSYNPFMMQKMRGLRQHDKIDIRGQFSGWEGSEGRMYDFEPTEIELVRDVRTG